MRARALERTISRRADSPPCFGTSRAALWTGFPSAVRRLSCDSSRSVGAERASWCFPRILRSERRHGVPCSSCACCRSRAPRPLRWAVAAAPPRPRATATHATTTCSAWPMRRAASDCSRPPMRPGCARANAARARRAPRAVSATTAPASVAPRTPRAASGRARTAPATRTAARRADAKTACASSSVRTGPAPTAPPAAGSLRSVAPAAAARRVPRKGPARAMRTARPGSRASVSFASDPASSMRCAAQTSAVTSS